MSFRKMNLLMWLMDIVLASQWESPVKVSQFYQYNLELYPLEFTTLSSVQVEFFLLTPQEGYITNVAWSTDAPQSGIYLSYCSKSSAKVFMENIPTDVEMKRWKFILTNDKLIVKCNDVTTLNFTFESSPLNPLECKERMRIEVGGVSFKKATITALKSRKSGHIALEKFFFPVMRNKFQLAKCSENILMQNKIQM